MNILDSYKTGLNAVLHPQQNTGKKMSIEDTLKMYYMFSIIPVVLFAILGAIFVSLVGGLLAFVPGLASLAGVLAGIGIVGVIGYTIVEFWIAIPIGILIIAALYQLLGGVVFKWFKGGYSASVTAVTYSVMAFVGVAWLAVIPIIGGIIVFLFWLWGIYVLMAALANQHGTTKGKAFAVWLIWVILAAIVFGISIFSIVSAIGSLPPTYITH